MDDLSFACSALKLEVTRLNVELSMAKSACLDLVGENEDLEKRVDDLKAELRQEHERIFELEDKLARKGED